MTSDIIVFENRKLLRNQRDIIRDVLLSARWCESWLSLDELQKLTKFKIESISSAMRALRDEFILDKRRKSGTEFLWEYQLRRKL